MLIVAHAISLDTCTRQLVGQPARSQVTDAQASYYYRSNTTVRGLPQQFQILGTIRRPLLIRCKQFDTLLMLVLHLDCSIFAFHRCFSCCVASQLVCWLAVLTDS